MLLYYNVDSERFHWIFKNYSFWSYLQIVTIRFFLWLTTSEHVNVRLQGYFAKETKRPLGDAGFGIRHEPDPQFQQHQLMSQ